MTNDLLVSGAVLFRKAKKGKISWLLVKPNEDSDWEIPKVTVRKGESSVRAAMRMMSDQAGMSTKVLEEAGRSSGTTSVNGKTIPKRELYYVMLLKAGGEQLGFFDSKWFDYSKAKKQLKTKKEKQFFQNARKEADIWLKKQRRM